MFAINFSFGDSTKNLNFPIEWIETGDVAFAFRAATNKMDVISDFILIVLFFVICNYFNISIGKILKK
jgi:hypothetical protein